MMAIRNIEVGDIHELLASIIRNDLTISENFKHIRFLAMFASYSLTFFNPVAGISHSVLRVSANEVVLPFTANISFDIETQSQDYSSKILDNKILLNWIV